MDIRKRAIAQAVRRRFLAPAVQVLSQVRYCGINGRKGGIEASLLRILRIPLPILIPPTTPH
jgi:hypothetical protein